MQPSSAQSLPISDIPPQQESVPPMPQPGSISSDGRSITAPSRNPDTELAAILARMASKFKPVEQEPRYSALTIATPPPVPETKDSASSPSAVPSGKVLRDDPEGQDQLTLLLSQAYASQNTYGDKAAMMEYRDQMFQQVLVPYPISLVREAFIEHIRCKANLPTPADIVNLIEPPEPTPDWAAYVGILARLKEGGYVSDDQKEYLRWCEKEAVAKPQQWREHIAELERKMTQTA